MWFFSGVGWHVKVKDRGKFSERINIKLSEEFNGILKVFSQNIGGMSGNKIKKTKPSTIFNAP